MVAVSRQALGQPDGVGVRVRPCGQWVQAFLEARDAAGVVFGCKVAPGAQAQRVLKQSPQLLRERLPGEGFVLLIDAHDFAQ